MIRTEKLPQTKGWRSVRKYPTALKTAPCPPHRKASRCTGFHTARVFTERYLRTGIRIVITPTLLCRLYCSLVLVFGVITCKVVYVTVYICLKYLVCVALSPIFRFDITCIVLLLCCTTDVSLEFTTICFVPLVSRFHWKVECLFCIFFFWKIFNGLRIVTWTSSQWCRSKFFCRRCYTRFFISNAFFLFKPQCYLTFWASNVA